MEFKAGDCSFIKRKRGWARMTKLALRTGKVAASEDGAHAMGRIIDAGEEDDGPVDSK